MGDTGPKDTAQRDQAPNRGVLPILEELLYEIRPETRLEGGTPHRHSCIVEGYREAVAPVGVCVHNERIYTISRAKAIHEIKDTRQIVNRATSCNVMGMMDDWKERLLSAVDADPRSDRAISLAAGLGPNFVNQLRKSETEPGVKKVLKLADELHVSLTALFLGADTSPEDEEFLGLLRSASEAERDGLLSLLRSRYPSKD